MIILIDQAYDANMFWLMANTPQWGLQKCYHMIYYQPNGGK